MFQTFGHFQNWLFWTDFHSYVYHLILFCITIQSSNQCTLLYQVQFTSCKNMTAILFLHSTVISVEQRPFHISLLHITIHIYRMLVFVLHFSVVNHLVIKLFIKHIRYGVPQDISFYYTLLQNRNRNLSHGIVRVRILGFPS